MNTVTIQRGSEELRESSAALHFFLPDRASAAAAAAAAASAFSFSSRCSRKTLYSSADRLDA